MIESSGDLKALIEQVVTNHQGCKATDVPVLIYRLLDNSDDVTWSRPLLTLLASEQWAMLPTLIQELVDEGKLVEVVYVVPGVAYRAESFLLPKDTRVGDWLKPPRTH
jgi:hypothetical protein